MLGAPRATCHAAACLLAATVLLCACTPIPAREAGLGGAEGDASGTDLFAYDAEARALQLGERVPDYPLKDVSGGALRLPDFRDRVVIMTFFAAGEDELDAEILIRFAEIEQSLGPAMATQVRLVSVLIDDSPQAQDLLRSHATAATREEVLWTFAWAAPDVTAAIAAAFGVVVWQTPEGDVAHTFNTVIIDRRGRFADQFPGFEGWSPMDVVASASVSAGR